jgi:hypothetical protein
MYLRHNGDSGFSSRNPNFSGNPDDSIEYQLDNGQLDVYPASWALPLAAVREALRSFLEVHSRPDFVTWHEE